MADPKKCPGAADRPPASKPRAQRATSTITVLCLAALCAAFFWHIRHRGPAAPIKTGVVRMACEMRVRDILRAIQRYATEHGRYPPAYIADKDGKPMHSWRVLIWPYLERNKAFRQYRWDEPWNSENNRKLADQMPRALRCPHDSESEPYETSFLLLAGPGTWFEGDASPRVDELPKPEKTILLIEAAGEKVHWMEPRDLDLSRFADEASVRTFHRHGKTCGLADGSIQVLKDEATVGDIRPFVRRAIDN